MESSSNTLAGPTTNIEPRNSTDRSNDSVTDELSVAGAELATEGQILANTPNPARAAPNPGTNPKGNATPLTHSNLNLLATLAAAASLTGKPRECGKTERPLGQSLAPTSSMAQNVSQVVSSLVSPPLLGVSPTNSGSLLGGAEFQGSIMDEIDPPTVLPDLNMAMAEGLVVVSRTEQQMGKEGSLVPATMERGIPVASAIRSTTSGSLSQQVKVEAAQTSCGNFSATQAESRTPSSASLQQQSENSATPQMQPNSVNSIRKSSTLSSSSSLAPKVSSQSAAIAQGLSASVTVPKLVPASQTVPSSGATPSQFPPPSSVTPIIHSSSSSASTSVPASQSTTSHAVGTTGSSSTSTLAKGLNLPLLQFLNLNFPSLKIKDLQDVLSINSLLTQVLKQQLNNPNSTSVTLQKVTEASKVGQSTLKTVLPGSKSSITVQSNLGGSKLARSQLQVPSKLGVASSTVSGASPRLGLSQQVSVTTVASSPRTSSPAVQLKAHQLAADGKAVDPKTQLVSTGVGINMDLLSKQSSSLLSTLASPSTSTATSAGNRKAVLVQILNKAGSSSPTTVTTTPPSKDPILIPRMMKPLSKGPLILNRHSRSQLQGISVSPSAYTTTASSSSRSNTQPSTPVSSLCVSLSLPALKGSLQPKDPAEKKRRTPSRKSAHQVTTTSEQQQMNRTVVQPAESEAMEVDVGQPVQKMKLPKHLRDHSYSLYNPEEAEKQRVLNATNFSFISTIPPARLSYAPQVPDSPSTLHKLLKVLPKKNSRHSPPRSGKGFGRRGRIGRKGRDHGKSRGKGGTKKVGSTPTLTTVSDPSSSESDSDEMSGKNRRRSQRNAGQRKRYIDDLNIPISDDELLEDVMSARPPTKKDYKGYGNQEEDDLDGWGAGGAGDGNTKDKLAAKHKSRTISINPTEGFQYSDVYFEPPAEEANLVERILAHRVRDPVTEEERTNHSQGVEEFFIKYKNYSYLHAEWATFEKLLQGDRRFDGKVKRYKAKQASLGIFSNVDEEPFNPEYTEVDRALDVATQTEPNGEVVTHYLVKWKSLPYEDATWELEEDIDAESIATFNRRQMVPSAKELSFVPRPPPASFKPIKETLEYKDGNLLRSYQREGLNWLLFNWYARQNCILADEMGLGKTVQSIAFLIEIFNARIRGPFLVIVPLSTIGNWQREFATWSDFNVIIYHGSAYSRRLIHEYDLYYRDRQGKIISDAFKFNVIVTTYEVLLSDDSELQNIDWRVVIIDEAHRLKNRNCKLLEGLKRLGMEHRVLLTGTPLQNSVEELFSLLNFLEPHTFPSHVSFLQQFGDLKTEEQVEELKTILKPMMLRRLKEDVEKSIAPKEETIIEVELTAIQKQYYRAILERNFMFLSRGSSAPTTAIPSLLNVMMELRKCCNHPFLIKGAEQKIVADWQTEKPTEPVYRSLIQASGKLVLIDKLLPKLKESGHKVLIFSQMVRCLDILEDYLRIKGYLYERIDGQVRGTLRQEAIDRFSKPDTDRFVFLLCTRAGGLGINLTAADTVIIYDSDWNPQNDIQAQARCHRIGQNKPVKVYRLITRNSYEREMFDRASLKLGLDKAVLHSVTTSQQQAAGPPQLSKREIEDLLKKGAYGALMEGNDDDANRFCEEDIDQILEQRAHVVQLESEGKDSTFSKASFVTDESSDINVDDPDFWQKWAEKAQLNLDDLANKDNLVLDTPRQRRQVRRYGNDHLEGEIVDMIDPREDVIPSRGRHGWTKIELFKTEKWTLIFGWGQWKDVLEACDFRKRQLGVGDVENISRTILIYCLAHFKGDEKIPPYIHRLIDPSEVTEVGEDAEGSQFTEDDYLALLSKNPETLFQEEAYMKHLRRHAHKIIFRIRQLHIIRWQMLVGHKKQIMKGTPARYLGLHLPRPEEGPPAPWWTNECDHSLIVGIFKHGYEQFHLFRSDPALCFKALVGEESQTSLRRKKNRCLPLSKGRKEDEEDEEEFLDLSGEDSDGESGPSTPVGLSVRLPNRKTKNIATNTQSPTPPRTGMYLWPTLADVNTRARRLVNAWIKNQKREEQKQVHLLKERVKREKEAEVSRKKEQKKAELAQKWSKREEQDFARVITFFGVVFDSKANKYNWTRFRQLANLTKKSDERLTLYLHDFQQMCRRVLRRKRIRRGLSGIRVEPINEDRSIRCLQRIELLSAVRTEILPHPDFDLLIELCEQSFEVPNWWIPGSHDRDLLRGVAKHGLFRSDQLIYGDPDLCFKQTVPQTALFDPTTNQVAFQEYEDDESGGSDDEEGPKLRSTLPPWSNPVPLGWPKEKAIAIRITRISYAFRNGVWPKPMEGLDLFNPTISDDSSDGSSMSEGESEPGGQSDDSDFEVATTRSSRRRASGLTVQISAAAVGQGGGGGEGSGERRDFEIEKQQGLKMIFKKSTNTPPLRAKSKGANLAKKKQPPEPPLKLEIRIPLVKLSFVSKAGLKPIPKKRPADRATGGPSDLPDSKSKRQKTQSGTQSSRIDPSKINFTDLNGHERVGVVNRNTNERLPLKQSPMLKNLKFWLEGHPHFNVDSKWGSLVIEWGALKPDMYHRVLLADPSEQPSTSSSALL